MPSSRPESARSELPWWGDLRVWLILGLILRVGALAFAPRFSGFERYVTGGDAAGYVNLARVLLAQGTFGFSAGAPTAFRMPGYPLFLTFCSLIGSLPRTAQHLQIAADLLTVFFAHRIGTRVCGSHRAGALAAGALTFHPLLATASITLYPETLTTLALTLGLYSLLPADEPRGRVLLGVIALGCATYLKPNMAVVALLLLVLHALRSGSRSSNLGRPNASALLPLVVFLTFLAPWAVRNGLVFDAFVPLTTSSGINLMGGNNPLADGGFVSDAPYTIRGMTEVESDRSYRARALDWIQSHPGQFLGLFPRKAGKFLSPISLGTSSGSPLPIPPALEVLAAVIQASFFLTALLGTFVLARSGRRWESAMLAAVPLILLAISLVTFGAARFAIPGHPALAILAAAVVQPIVEPS